MGHLERARRRLAVAFGGTVLAACAGAWFFARAPLKEPDERALIATSRPLSPDEELKQFHLPPGFQIELVAAEPDVLKPANMNFDAHGRLYVRATDMVRRGSRASFITRPRRLRRNTATRCSSATR